jgi:hypothetical protein
MIFLLPGGRCRGAANLGNRFERFRAALTRKGEARNVIDFMPAGTRDLERIRANLTGIWDVDFDAQCNTYLTSLVSGPDFATIVPGAGGAASTYLGNANQNMGYGLVDPDPTNQRVVVTYSCCENCNCLAKNGITLLYTCSGPGCGCEGQTNCPGFLDAPFLPTAVKDTGLMHGGIQITSPTGLAAGPGNTYFVGNFEPEVCADEEAGARPVIRSTLASGARPVAPPAATTRVRSAASPSSRRRWAPPNRRFESSRPLPTRRSSRSRPLEMAPCW